MSHEYVYQALNGRVMVVGDIHGSYEKLIRALDNVAFDYSKDKVVCCGDLIDRGSESVEMIKLIEEPWFHAVKGNHDHFAIKVFDSILADDVNKSSKLIHSWIEPRNGGGWFTSQSKANQEFCLSRGRDLLCSLPSAISIAYASGLRIGVIHADPLLSNWSPAFYESLTGDDEWRAMSSRKLTSSEPDIIAGIDAVCVGHTVVANKLSSRGNILFCDTGGWKLGREIQVFSESDIKAELDSSMVSKSSQETSSNLASAPARL